jgi:DNA modification methylase
LSLPLPEYFTFEASKSLPFHRWFYYKEAYAPQIVRHYINAFSEEKPVSSVFDPFCGIGTTPLTCRNSGIKSAGIDASPLAVFISRTKCDEYSQADIEDAKSALKSMFKERKEPTFSWDFELFSPRRFFSKRTYSDICMLREKIEELENEKAGALLLLSLLSALPQCGFFIKDGGVLRLQKSKRAMPIKDAFKRKVKQVISDLENSSIPGPKPEISLADARNYSEGKYDIFITSPPYLNNIDYSKVYGLELSLLSMDKNASLKMRSEAVRSFITKDARETKVPEEAGEIGHTLPIAGEYFADMEKVLSNLYKISERGGVVIVGNSVIHQTHIVVDEILGKIGERIGFSYEIPLWKERIADVKPAKLKTRESAIVFTK